MKLDSTLFEVMTLLRLSGDCVIVIAWAAQFSSSRVSTVSRSSAAHDEMLAALGTEARGGGGGGGVANPI